MSIQRNPNKAVPTLLNRMNQAKTLTDRLITTSTAEKDDLSTFNEFEKELNRMEDLFPRVKYWEQNLLHQFMDLDRQLHNFILEFHNNPNDVNGMLRSIVEDIKQLKTYVSPVQQMPVNYNTKLDPTRHSFWGQDDMGRKDSRKWLQLSMKDIVAHPAVENLKVSYDNLENLELKLCLLFLSVFPENAVIKKRPLIYWWIGEGLITKTTDKTAEEIGEDIFKELLKLDLIIPSSNRSTPVVNKCKVHPWIRYLLISLAENAEIFDFDPTGTPFFGVIKSRRACLFIDNQKLSGGNGFNYENLRTIFNVNEGYLSFTSEWLSKLKRVMVLQLGRWQESPTHHIEVLSEEFLKGLGGQKHLKYLSLRGISRITALPPSISGLISLEILDLRACHNLEELPADIASLKKLTHLDISECYLLGSIPKGIAKLSSLQVLKGFVVGNSKKSPCRLSDLKGLTYLKRLSLHIGSEAVIQDGEFDELQYLKRLSCLKISWGKKEILDSISFPPDLETLDLEGIPDETPKWLTPSRLLKLKKLYIKGGRLRSLKGDWKLDILHLRYMKNLESFEYRNNLKEFGKSKDSLKQFRDLRYLEIINCDKINEGREIVWNKDDN